jgi:SAM-dependent methyltransferase
MHPPRYILAPYLATPPEVVERMLDLADVGEGDVVYDLGCGDGRVAIAAARRGARAVGVDIEEHWVDEARRAAAAAGVAAQVRFEQADAMHYSLEHATVVCLYLVNWSTERVLQRLQAECAPGTRVVSHSFGFGAAGGRSVSVVDAEGQARQLHLLVLDAPA